MRLTAMNFLAFLLAALSAAAQSPKVEWPDGHKAAIALTYDDALTSQLDNALPALDMHGFKATFYLTIDRPGFTGRIEAWRAAAANGHELGNHTLFHPCRASLPDRDWVEPEIDLDTYSVARMVNEVEMTNTVLTLVDGRESRSYAYPCGEAMAGGESYTDAIRSLVSGARGATGYTAGAPFDPMQVATWGPVEVSGNELIAYAERILEEGGFGTFTFHGIGGDYLSVSAQAHTELLAWLDKHRSDIWVAPFQTIIRHADAADGATE